jgi:diguanylate cyclase (GGDEF)-like protein
VTQPTDNLTVLSAHEAEAGVHGRLPRRLSAREFTAFAAAGERRSFEVGERLIRRGEIGRSMFVIESGRVQLEFGGDQPGKSLGAHEYFGELSLFIGDHVRVAGALATDAGVAHVLDQGAFDALLEREPRLVADFMRRSFAYLVASEQKLIASLTCRNEDLLQTLDSLRQTQDQLHLARRQTRTDDLTGLYNRRGLYAFLDEIADQPQARLGLLLIDLDHFKQINDRYGHLMGDRVLCAVADEVRAAAGTVTDLPCRLGGDEFALLLQADSLQALNQRAAQIAAGVRSLRFATTDDALTVSVSIGGHLCPPGRIEWSNWYSRADAALYRAKAHGGDGLHIAG